MIALKTHFIINTSLKMNLTVCLRCEIGLESKTSRNHWSKVKKTRNEKSFLKAKVVSKNGNYFTLDFLNWKLNKDIIQSSKFSGARYIIHIAKYSSLIIATAAVDYSSHHMEGFTFIKLHLKISNKLSWAVLQQSPLRLENRNESLKHF